METMTVRCCIGKICYWDADAVVTEWKTNKSAPQQRWYDERRLRAIADEEEE